MTYTPFLLLVLGLLPSLVSGHGFVLSVSIDGTSYQGNLPGGTDNPSIIRQVSTISPVQPATDPSMFCGMNSTVAANVANANPGSQLQIYWEGSVTGTSDWPHNTGPIMTYMTQCSGSCSSYDNTNAEWFKISELGVIPPNNSTWYQGYIMEGEPANVTIPSTIAPGQYLLRSELIALQNAVSVDGAEFYPSCIQLNIGGSGTGAPTSSETCTFPGCYSVTDPGIYDPTVYDAPVNYIFPGPPVAAFVGAGASVGGTQSSNSSGSSSGGSSSTPTTGSSSPTASGSSEPTNTSSPSPTTTIASTSAPSATPSGNSTSGNGTASDLGATCYLTTSSSDVLAKRSKSKRGTHKRRLVRRGSN